MDNPKVIEKYDDQLRQIMLDMRHDGIPHKTIHHVFSELTKDLAIMAKAEGELSLARPEKPRKGHQ